MKLIGGTFDEPAQRAAFHGMEFCRYIIPTQYQCSLELLNGAICHSTEYIMRKEGRFVNTFL